VRVRNRSVSERRRGEKNYRFTRKEKRDSVSGPVVGGGGARCVSESEGGGIFEKKKGREITPPA